MNKNIKNLLTEKQDNRLYICNDCDLNDNGICLSCNCIILKKILKENTVCPKQKW